jgi:hypothetical protein
MATYDGDENGETPAVDPGGLTTVDPHNFGAVFVRSAPGGTTGTWYDFDWRSTEARAGSIGLACGTHGAGHPLAGQPFMVGRWIARAD